MTDNLPKVLIIGQPFNKVSGGGITLSNLFKIWPKEKLLLATNTHRALKNDFSICSNVYLLGKDEVRIPFLLRPLLKNAQSGVIKVGAKAAKYDLAGNPSIISKSSIFYNTLVKILKLLDLNYILFRINVSRKFENWIVENKPDIIYTQLGHLEFNDFILKLKSRNQLPLVVHIMDDWPEKSAVGLFKNYWQKKLRESFKKVLEVTDELITISESMRDEYKQRYNKGRYYFHNPIRIDPQIQNYKHITLNSSALKMGYFGRISSSNTKGLIKAIDAVAKLTKAGHRIHFDIYTPDIYALKSVTNKYCQILKPIPHDQALSYMGNYHVLFLPLDFDNNSRKYARYSFPTKASEYMAAGRLILVFGPEGTFAVDHAKKYNWAAVVENNSIEALSEELKQIYNNYSRYTNKIITAHQIAVTEFNEKIVCKNFAELFIEIVEKQNIKD